MIPHDYNTVLTQAGHRLDFELQLRNFQISYDLNIVMKWKDETSWCKTSSTNPGKHLMFVPCHNHMQQSHCGPSTRWNKMGTKCYMWLREWSSLVWSNLNSRWIMVTLGHSWHAPSANVIMMVADDLVPSNARPSALITPTGLWPHFHMNHIMQHRCCISH